MRAFVLGAVLITAVGIPLLLCTPSGGGQETDEAGLAAEEGREIDLLPGKGLEGWKRVPIAPDTKLNTKNPWKVDEGGRVLHCDGVGVKEMFLYDREFADGTFHVEWRFRKVTDRKDYNSGIYVRTSADGKVWHQAQVAHLEKAPRMADLFGDTLEDGKPKKLVVEGMGTKLVHGPGEWNTYDITCKGPKVTVEVNGKLATTWDNCQVPRGHVGLQAEYFDIEFKNLRFKPLQ
jgi:hypothetical protein